MIQSGFVDFGAPVGGWNLNTGAGNRTFTSSDIAFQPPFAAPPQIVLALSGVDADRSTNLRVRVHASDVEAEEFNINVTTWDDTILHSVLVTWIAYSV